MQCPSLGTALRSYYGALKSSFFSSKEEVSFLTHPPCPPSHGVAILKTQQPGSLNCLINSNQPNFLGPTPKMPILQIQRGYCLEKKQFKRDRNRGRKNERDQMQGNMKCELHRKSWRGHISNEV